MRPTSPERVIASRRGSAAIPSATCEKAPFWTSVPTSRARLKNSSSIRVRRAVVPPLTMSLISMAWRLSLVPRYQPRQEKREHGKGNRHHGEQDPRQSPHSQQAEHKVVDGTDDDDIGRQDGADQAQRNHLDVARHQELEEGAHARHGRRGEIGSHHRTQIVRDPPHGGDGAARRRAATSGISLIVFGTKAGAAAACFGGAPAEACAGFGRAPFTAARFLEVPVDDGRERGTRCAGAAPIRYLTLTVLGGLS